MLPRRRLSHAQGYLELGLFTEAGAELDRVPPPLNQHLEYFLLRFAVLQEQRDWSALRTVAAEAVRLFPAEPSAWVTWAYAVRRAESLAAAEAILLAAETAHPADATIQFNLGCYACQRGPLAAARTHVDRAILLDPAFAALAATDEDLAPLRAATPPL